MTDHLQPISPQPTVSGELPEEFIPDMFKSSPQLKQSYQQIFTEVWLAVHEIASQPQQGQIVERTFSADDEIDLDNFNGVTVLRLTLKDDDRPTWLIAKRLPEGMALFEMLGTENPEEPLYLSNPEPALSSNIVCDGFQLSPLFQNSLYAQPYQGAASDLLCFYNRLRLQAEGINVDENRLQNDWELSKVEVIIASSSS